MEITIIGWYGTETIGDRAILGGIFHILSQVFSSCKIRLGSLFPFFSERSLYEDMDFYKDLSSDKNLSISLFDSRNPVQLRNNIRNSDFLIVGGGPLMDLNEMSMLEYAFLFAKKKHVKTMLFGCGWGPLKKKTIIDKTVHLVELSDCVVFRDDVSKNQCLCYCTQFADKIHSAIDPAVFACMLFNQHETDSRKEDHIAINFRDVALEGDHYCENGSSEKLLADIVSDIAQRTDLPVNLVPMHSFCVGGDDREILTRIERKVALSNVKAIQKPLSLYETMQQYYHAKLCVGMRFHAVVLQTVLNGNNYVVDYTNPSTGKIPGLLQQIDNEEFYKNRYFSLHTNQNMFTVDMLMQDRFVLAKEVMEGYRNQYVNCLNDLWQ